MAQSISKRAVLLFVTVVFIMAAGISLYASTTVGAQLGDLASPNYNYSPSVIQTGNIQQFWWCGYAYNAAENKLTDTIQYKSVNLSTHATVAPEVVLVETPGTWDSEFTCNPKVVKGTFTNRLETA